MVFWCFFFSVLLDCVFFWVIYMWLFAERWISSFLMTRFWCLVIWKGVHIYCNSDSCSCMEMVNGYCRCYVIALLLGKQSFRWCYSKYFFHCRDIFDKLY